MRKELVVYVSTNEQDEEVKVQRVPADPQFFLLTLGQNRMVVNIAEFMDAVGTISHFSAMFDEEQKMRTARLATAVPHVAPVVNLRKADDEGLVMDAPARSGPTASELALEKMTHHMQGDTLIVTEKKHE